MLAHLARRKAVVFLFALAAFISGCATVSEGDRLSERPWNAPRNWEHGLPTSILEGR